ncbi:MAG: bifunctional glycosyltransferase family 2/GtrA family protein [Clostridia bacterium]|nr:bifunctional glycosyltransferase family 2/GtrA family protein [Clostridia bacterium]
MKYYILIPAYKPDEKLIAFIDTLLAANLDILVVNDGSGEAYEHIFDQVRERNVELVVHETNLGKGAALKTGIATLKKDPEVAGIVTADADGQHSFEDTLATMEALKCNPDAIVLGVRSFSAKDVPTRSKIGNYSMRITFLLMTGLKVTDTQTGLRGLPRMFFDELLQLEGDRYEYETNMLLAVKSWHSHFVEVPIRTIYIDENKGSSFNTMKDTILILKQLLKYSASSLVCTLVDYGIYILLCKFFPIVDVPLIQLGTMHIDAFSIGAPVWVIVARFFSASLNYTLNRHLVFKKSGKKTLLKFAALVTVIALLAATLVNLLITHLHFTELFAKICVDVPLFFINYFIQKRFIFTKPTAKV